MGGGVVSNALVAQPGVFPGCVACAPVSSDSVDNFDKWVRRDPSRSGAAAGHRPPRHARGAAGAVGDDERPHLLRPNHRAAVIHHGTADEDCPLAWSRESVAALEARGKRVGCASIRRAAHPHARHSGTPRSGAPRAFLAQRLS